MQQANSSLFAMNGRHLFFSPLWHWICCSWMMHILTFNGPELLYKSDIKMAHCTSWKREKKYVTIFLINSKREFIGLFTQDLQNQLIINIINIGRLFFFFLLCTCPFREFKNIGMTYYTSYKTVFYLNAFGSMVLLI